MEDSGRFPDNDSGKQCALSNGPGQISGEALHDDTGTVARGG